MALLQVQQLSRHPTDYGAEILVQVIMMMLISMIISLNHDDADYFSES